VQYDYLILGQGICGSFISKYLLQENVSVLVIDNAQPYTSSRVACGMINPVTGRRIVTTWMIDELMPFAINEYENWGKELGIDLVNEFPILDFYPSLQMRTAFEERLQNDNEYLHKIPHEEQWNNYFRFYFGIGEIKPAYSINFHSLLTQWHEQLKQRNLLWEENFSWNYFSHNENGVKYKDITAKKIICCEGCSAIHNPYFHRLPFALNKGEICLVSIPGLPRKNMYKQGITIVPFSENEDIFWIGSSYEWDYKDVLPSENFRKKVIMQLDNFSKLPYTIETQWASERPANIERRPFAGIHPQYKNIAILNGMGAKGTSLTPYFSKQLVHHLLRGNDINPLADVQRFARVLS
jgi:glycine/D-amino acid oxidase-like deaminating enzyme